jgi:hypothetical protein
MWWWGGGGGWGSVVCVCRVFIDRGGHDNKHPLSFLRVTRPGRLQVLQIMCSIL